MSSSTKYFGLREERLGINQFISYRYRFYMTSWEKSADTSITVRLKTDCKILQIIKLFARVHNQKFEL